MSKPPAADPDFEARKRASVAQLLFKCARLVNERALARVNEEPHAIRFRPAHTNLFPHLDFEGVRITELARRLDISKQAISQTIAELELMDVVETIADPSDGRARLARFTEKGKFAILQGLGVLREIETDMERTIGKSKFDALHDALLALEQMLEKPSEAALGNGERR
ncbi:MAG TPA: MarR family transcriptional regulator [Polyangiaceae bacterium]|nr:MarR family transcriptional regulator [Polyangiaceae bacterium]